MDFLLELGVCFLVLLWLFNIHGVRLKGHVYQALYSGFWLFLLGRVFDCLDEIYDLNHSLWLNLEGGLELAGIGLISIGLWLWGRENRRLFRDLMAGKESLEREAVLDQLTGLYNRTYYDRVVPDLVSQAHVTERFLSMMVLDIDRFKAINDNHGHLVGDHVIAAMGDVVRATLRDSDPAFRYGGEEVVVLLRDIHLDQALGIAERLRINFAARRFQAGELRFGATMSIGVTQLAGADQPRSFFERADRAMYIAKQSGRDQVAFLRAESGPA
ncbi:diguanylate cyclase [Acanthopleuribacter pedis]|uniref:diguanylate cyclase n=1 Tax=Acanthopleuribacter pedis TaxID=442870 RepID=A0A8J7U7J1_9BACT|nr:GGDEF domain-containing protein [Acanthopleuribacter pedis]